MTPAGLTAAAAWWFLPALAPIAIFVAWSDLKRMKIPNIAVGAMVICFAVLGLIALPLSQYLWQWTHLVVMLVIGIMLNAARVMGAGDAKFIAAAAPFVALADLHLIAILFATCLLAGFATHRLVKHSPLRRWVPDWQSWSSGRKFPMGFPLAMTLIFYLIMVIIYR